MKILTLHTVPFMQRRIDHNSDRAWFRQLADILRGRVVSGEWEPDRNLPSEASLGHEYEVSQITVRQALAVLRAEGVVESVRGRPWRVRDRGETSVIKARPGDRVTARPATRDDQERHGVPEGTVVIVVQRQGKPEQVYRADEYVYEVDPGD